MLVVNLFEDFHYDNEDIVLKELMQTKFSKEISIAMQTHQFMQGHESEYPLVLHVISGSVKLMTDDDVVTLVQGDLIEIDTSIKHCIEAIENSLLRLSVFTDNLL
ncbi:MAG: hypothetical protein U9N52_03380 [Campylobacterota bacterium]|nr:hypothetical protein [Campylobacterota bacterium]